MTSITFDTLEYSKTLQEAGMPQKQAEAIATAQKKAVQEVINAQQFATKGDIQTVKADLQAVRTELKEDIAATQYELLKWMIGLSVAQVALVFGILAYMK